MKQTDIAYIAGLMDGEGCIRIKKEKAYACQDRKTPGYHASVQIKMVEEGAIRFVRDMLGGWYYRQKSSVKNGRPLYCWQSSDRQAETILKTILPYLRVKHDQADLVLKLRTLQSNSKKHRTKVTGYRDFPDRFGTVRRVANYSLSDQYVAQCETLFLQCKEFNRVGIR